MKIKFGRFAGKTVDNVPTYYLEWLLQEASDSLTEEEKAAIRNLLKRRKRRTAREKKAEEKKPD